MKGKYLKRIGGFVLAGLMLSGVAFASASTAQAQGRRRVIVPNPNRTHRPFRYRSRFDVFGYDRWGYDRWGFDRFGRDRWGNERFGYDPWSPYGSLYRQYVFENSEKAVNQGYKDGFKTGKDDGKKAKSFNPQRSHFYEPFKGSKKNWGSRFPGVLRRAKLLQRLRRTESSRMS